MNVPSSGRVPFGVRASTSRRPDAPRPKANLAPMTSSITVRPARPQDMDFVVSLSPRFAEDAPRTRDPGDILSGTIAWLRRAFENPPPGSEVLVAQDGAGRPAGFIYLNEMHDFFTGRAYGHVGEIAVATDRGGVGRALMEAGEAWARARGYTRLTLNVFVTKTAPQAFYRSIGFEPEQHQFVKLLNDGVAETP